MKSIWKIGARARPLSPMAFSRNFTKMLFNAILAAGKNTVNVAPNPSKQSQTLLGLPPVLWWVQQLTECMLWSTPYTILSPNCVALILQVFVLLSTRLKSNQNYFWKNWTKRTFPEPEVSMTSVLSIEKAVPLTKFFGSMELLIKK